jgi:hypothetical protein
MAEDRPLEQARDMAQRNALYVKILSAEKSLYEGEVKALTSYNETGKFDILPFHANFISIIYQHITVHEKTKSKKEFDIDGAVMRVLNNEVDIFLGLEKTNILDPGMMVPLGDVVKGAQPTVTAMPAPSNEAAPSANGAHAPTNATAGQAASL